MTVKELIALLSKMPKESEVVTEHSGDAFSYKTNRVYPCIDNKGNKLVVIST